MLKNASSRTAYPGELRRIVALVEVKGKKVEMEFITNNLEWAASSVCDIYQSRWENEVFFKQIKQNLKLCDFLGNNANAVRWQVWMALLAYVLLRYLGYQSDWNHSFSRLCTMVRGVLWEKMALRSLLFKILGNRKRRHQLYRQVGSAPHRAPRRYSDDPSSPVPGAPPQADRNSFAISSVPGPLPRRSPRCCLRRLPPGCACPAPAPRYWPGASSPAAELEQRKPK